MSKPLIIEEESGTSTRARHPHNGYYAGDFTSAPCNALFHPIGATGRPPVEAPPSRPDWLSHLHRSSGLSDERCKWLDTAAAAGGKGY